MINNLEDEGTAEATARALPHNTMMEDQVIAALTLDGGGGTLADRIFAVLKPDDFFDGDNAQVFQCLKDLWAEARGLTMDMLEVRLKECGVALASGDPVIAITSNQMAVRMVEDAIPHSAYLADLSMLRRLHLAGKEIAEEAYAPKMSPGMFAERCLVKLEGIVSARYQRGVSGWSKPEDTDAVVDTLLGQDADDGVRHVAGRSGLAEIDNVLHWIPGEMMVVAARPSVGKTSLALQVALESAVMGPVAFFCYEMDHRVLRGKAACQLASVAYSDARRGRLLDDESHRLDLSRKKLKDLPIHFFDTSACGSLTVERIRDELLRLTGKLGQPPAVVIVDYIQRMPVSKQVARATTSDQIGHASKRLADLARELPTRMMMLSQLNRESERDGKRGSNEPNRVRMSDIRGSGDIEQDAHSILAIESPAFEEGCRMRQIRIRLLKNRLGEKGLFQVTFNAAMGTFKCEGPVME